ncbi:hypothetical protein CRUP_001463, partial [Coryphaenoides rupestris]
MKCAPAGIQCDFQRTWKDFHELSTCWAVLVPVPVPVLCGSPPTPPPKARFLEGGGRHFLQKECRHGRSLGSRLWKFCRQDAHVSRRFRLLLVVLLPPPPPPLLLVVVLVVVVIISGLTRHARCIDALPLTPIIIIISIIIISIISISISIQHQHPRVDEVLVSVGRKYGKSSAQVALRFNVQRGVVVIPKSFSPQRIHHNAQ